MSRARQLAQWGRTTFWQKSYQIKRSFKLTSTTSSHLFHLGYLQKGPWHFSTIQTIDDYFRIFRYQFSVVAYLATILRIKYPKQKIQSPWRLKWPQLGRLLHKTETGTIGRGHWDACEGTWDLGLGDARVGTWGYQHGTQGRMRRRRGDVKYRNAGDVRTLMFIAKVQGKCEIYRMCHYTTGDSTIIIIYYFV